ncbi:hypothetical protein HZH66_003520 [Vespula vulgaris]|uniref:Uncharacterized protein n=1 Tax=Vespula vulgaris TaxID=7454 RepID=A0A834NDZ9_VESVU|nr:hypothetical protein HZH66_003520 [Vespula vulgaris]
MGVKHREKKKKKREKLFGDLLVGEEQEDEEKENVEKENENEENEEEEEEEEKIEKWGLISLFDKKGFSTMHTFPAHAHLQALLQPAELALISVMLVDGTVPGSPTRVRQVPPDTPLEEALAS